MNVRSFVFAALFFAPLAACSSSTDNADLTEGKTENASADLAVLCGKGACGPGLEMPTIICADGSTAGNTGRCIHTKTSAACHWEILECPPSPTPVPPTPGPSPVPPIKDCSAANACGPGLGMPNELCWDGSIGGPVCEASSAGTCGWVIRKCPPPPAELVCGKTASGAVNYCKKGQTCCDGMPLTHPTCVDGTACPISQRKHKKDINYLSDSERQTLNDELMSFRLASYHYKSEGIEDRKQLGFIIDDVAPSAAVMGSGERVDMYGYQTMAVAALQTQAKEIGELRKQVEDLQRSCKKH